MSRIDLLSYAFYESLFSGETEDLTETSSDATATPTFAPITGEGLETFLAQTELQSARRKMRLQSFGANNLLAAQTTTQTSNGDFNLDGVINIDDYGMIDFAFPLQGAPL